MKVEYIDDDKPTGVKKRPSIIPWHGEKIFYQHSFTATIAEIVDWTAAMDLTKIGLVGTEGSGKTTLAMTIAHAIHKMAHKKHKLDFVIRQFGQDELADLDQTLAQLQPVNHILIFDDVSYLTGNMTKKEIDHMKQLMTKIRHLPGGTDIKIVTIFNYHYSRAFDKYMRQTDFKYVLTVGDEEKENVQKAMNAKTQATIDKFRKYRSDGILTGEWTSGTGRSQITYKFRKPFIPVLYIGHNGGRIVISPTRQWLDKTCGICAQADGTAAVDFDIDKFLATGRHKFGVGNFNAALKLNLYEAGIMTYSAAMHHAVMWVRKYLHKNNTPYDEILKVAALKGKRGDGGGVTGPGPDDISPPPGKPAKTTKNDKTAGSGLVVHVLKDDKEADGW